MGRGLRARSAAGQQMAIGGELQDELESLPHAILYQLFFGLSQPCKFLQEHLHHRPAVDGGVGSADSRVQLERRARGRFDEKRDEGSLCFQGYCRTAVSILSSSPDSPSTSKISDAEGSGSSN